MPDVQGRCPACGAASLFLGEGGHVTCARTECPNPCATDDLLHGGEEALVHALGGDRTARVIAYNLHCHGHSLADVRRMSDEEFRAVPGIGDTSLATIRRAFPEQPPSRAGDVLTALGRRVPETLAKGISRDDYALAPTSEPPVVAVARIGLDVAVTPSDYALARAAAKPSAARDLAELQRRAARVTRKTDATVTVAPCGAEYQVTIERGGGTTVHGGYGFHAVQGILLGVMAAADCLATQTPLRVRVATAIRPWLLGADEADVEAAVRDVLAVLSTPTADAPVPQDATGRPTHPDGNPYRYHEIVAEGWGHCDGCRTWGRGWTAENPHDCPGTYVKGPTTEEAPDA
ncbi:hypothetical protein [Streptomyces californicus]|uniref:hypothetical protein n=1 Tax=Streptomyces californicus TaxID=67351 RepID=UPI003815EBC8